MFLSMQSADQELFIDFLVVRSLANQLVKQEPLATRYLELVSTNVVGPDGIAIQVKNKSKNGKLATRQNKAILDRFNDWGKA